MNLTNQLATKATLCRTIADLSELTMSLHDDKLFTKEDAVIQLLKITKDLEKLAYENIDQSKIDNRGVQDRERRRIRRRLSKVQSGSTQRSSKNRL